MGICTEFGPHIRTDCKEPMIAGSDSCSCPTCGAVCSGKFAACARVWARGPQPVTLRSRTLGLPSASVSSHGATPSNGNGHGQPTANGTPASFAAPELVDTMSFRTAGVEPPVLHALLDEIKQLGRLIEQTGSAVGGGNATEAKLDYTNSLLESLPERIADAVSDALARQHKLIMKDVDDALRDLATRLGPSRNPRRSR